MAFKEMHEQKIELADKIHFVNIASERSNLASGNGNTIPSSSTRITGKSLKSDFLSYYSRPKTQNFVYFVVIIAIFYTFVFS